MGHNMKSPFQMPLGALRKNKPYEQTRLRRFGITHPMVPPSRFYQVGLGVISSRDVDRVKR